MASQGLRYCCLVLLSPFLPSAREPKIPTVLVIKDGSISEPNHIHTHTHTFSFFLDIFTHAHDTSPHVRITIVKGLSSPAH